VKRDIDEDLCAAAYTRGSSIQELAIANGVSYGTMHRMLSARDDVEMRRTGSHHPVRQALLDERSGVRREPRQDRRRPEKARIAPRPPGRILRAYISQLGLSQNAAAKQAGMSASNLSLLISGKRTISIPVARKLQAGLRISAERLLIEQVRWQLHRAAAPQAAGHTPLRI